MPHFIDKPVVNGRRIYVVANETTVGENFAERWNTEPARVAAFYEWHAKALADFEALPNLQGIDVIGKSLRVPADRDHGFQAIVITHSRAS
ncbi:hypothetical protein ACVWW4_006660 [Bradyrhizobium sp. LB7.1]